MPQPLPASGQVITGYFGHEVAPFEVVTPPNVISEHFYVRLVDTTTSVSRFSMFVRGGERAQARVPPGIYELRYAVGETWYGPEHLFGPNTMYSKANKTLDFKQIGSYLSGYTVELYLQPGGNLETERISADKF